MENENREWKESELGRIPVNWELKMIEEVEIYINDGNYGGKYPKNSEFDRTGIPFISASNLSGREIIEDDMKYISEELHSKLQKGHTELHDILIVVRGNGVGTIGMINEEYVNSNLNAQLAFLRPKSINKFYLYYLLSSKEYKNILTNYSSGSAQPQLPIGKLKKVKIKLPPLPEQKRIAEILSSLDDKIELNNQMNKTLEEMAQAIFKQWFVDFEFPNENGEPYKSSGGEMKESELGFIPKGWRVKELKEIFIFVKGRKPKDIYEKKDENMESYLTIDVLSNNGKLFALPEKTILANKFNNLMVMDGASSGTVFYGKNGIVASTLAKLDVIDTGFSDEILYTIIKHYENDIRQHTTGSAIPHTDKEYIYKIKVPTPNENILKNFSNIIKSIRSAIINNNEEANILIETRDTLLPRLMNGEINLNEV